jgi:hypothetical protein
LSEIRIIGPDGQRFVFPAGTDPEVMKSAMRRRYTGETRRTTEMIYNTQLPDERMQGARDYLARDQLRQDMEAGRQARRTEEATGPENIAKERFYTGAQGRTLGAAPLIQGAINIPISAMMYPFLTQEQKAGRSFDEFVSDMSSVGYDQARGSIERSREKRPLESLGLEIAGGFIAGKTAYDDLGNRFLASQPGARGALVGAGSGAQYEFLESEGDPLAAGRGALIGAPVGAGVSKAMEAAAEPLGRLFRGEVPVPKIGPDATGAAYGAGLGGIAPADSAEERAQNMAVGAGIGLAPGVINRVRGAGAPRAMPDTMPAGAGDNPYFGRQSMRPPGSGPSAREIETRQQWATATPIVTQARTTAQSAQAAADAALQSKAPADIARAKDQKKALVSQIKEAQASRAGMDTPEDARLAETLASLTENTSDPVLLSTQISAAKTSLDRLLTDIGSPVEGNLIPVRTNILTRTQAPRSAVEGPQDRASVTRYAEGELPPIKSMGFSGPGGFSMKSAVETPEPDMIKWADENVTTKNLSGGEKVLKIKSSEVTDAGTPRKLNDITLKIKTDYEPAIKVKYHPTGNEFSAEGVYVDMSMGGRFERDGGKPSLKDVAKASRAFSKSIGALRAYAAKEKPGFITFSSATKNHAKLYSYLLENYDFPGYKFYAKTNAETLKLIDDQAARTANSPRPTSERTQRTTKFYLVRDDLETAIQPERLSQQGAIVNTASPNQQMVIKRYEGLEPRRRR